MTKSRLALALPWMFALSQLSIYSLNCGVTAFVAPSHHTKPFVINEKVTTSKTEIRATAADAIASLAASQSESVNSIAASIPDLAPKPDLSWTAADNVLIGGSIATLDGRDAPGPANVAWLSDLCIAGKLSSLTIFNGPLTDVPHLISRCVIPDESTMKFYLDFRPRAYGAYELRDAAGNYPGPEQLGREAFTYSGNRKDYDTKFGNEELIAFMKSTFLSFEGVAITRAPNEFESLTSGPLVMDATMPLTDGNVAAAIAARQKAVQYWIQWALDDSHGHRPGAPINSQYVYDSKYRQNSYSALMPIYTELFGPEDGSKLSAAESGPLDEAYVGGGS